MKQLDLFGAFDEPAREEKKQQEDIAAETKPVEEIPVSSEETFPADDAAYLQSTIPQERFTEAPEATEEKLIDAVDEPIAEDGIITIKNDIQPAYESIAGNGFDLLEGIEESPGFIEMDPVEDIILAAKEADEEAKKEPADDIIPLEEHGLYFTANNNELTDSGIKEEPSAEVKAEEKNPASVQSSSIVFEDDKIAVKIKVKQPPPVEPDPPLVFKEPEKRTALVVVKKRGRKSFKEIDAEVDLVEVPDDDILFDKQYYSISQVAYWFHVNTSLVRYWENEFDILKPRKNRKGDRLFRPEDVKNLQVIYYLLRQRKFSIEGAKKYLKDNKKSADTNIQLIQSLTKFRGFLLELKANLGA